MSRISGFWIIILISCSIGFLTPAAFAVSESFTFSLDQHSAISNPVILESNNPDHQKIFFVSEDRLARPLLYGLNNSGNLLPGFPIDLLSIVHYSGNGSRNYFNQLALADINGDGEKELAVAIYYDFNYPSGYYRQSRLFVFTQNGTVYSEWPPEGVSIENRTFSTYQIGADDLDRDGKSELIVLGTNLNIFAKDGSSYNSHFPIPNIGSGAAISVGDINQDGIDEIIVADSYPNALLHAINPRTGTDVAHFPVALNNLAGSMATAVGDLNQDGQLEIVVVGEQPFLPRHVEVQVYNASGALIPGWPQISPELVFGSFSSPALADLDHDGNLEIVLEINNQIFVYQSNGLLFPGWPQPFENPNSFFSYDPNTNVTIADLNGDQNKDIVHFSKTNGYVHIWDASGNLFPGIPLVLQDNEENTETYSVSTPILIDMKKDGDLNVVLTVFHNEIIGSPINSAEIHCLDLTEGIQSLGDLKHDWLQFHKDASHSGLYFNSVTFTLQVGIVGSGLVARNPDQLAYAPNSEVTLTAFPNAHYVFSHWRGDWSGSQNPIVIQMNRELNGTAVFKKRDVPAFAQPPCQNDQC